MPRSYCGNNILLPLGYTHFGTPYECLQKGIGFALYNLCHQRRRRTSNILLPLAISILLLILLVSVLIYLRI